jgi:hypothetical protein
VASKHAGASINDVTDEQFVDQLTGTAALSGQQVKIRAMHPAAVRSEQIHSPQAENPLPTG